MEAIGPEIPLRLPRYAFSPRNAARAGAIWRLFQEAAVADSSRRGWPPGRYLEEGTGFVVYAVTARHHRAPVYGEHLRARTWIRDFRRGILSRREVRLVGESGPVADATQKWAHVSAAMKPSAAPRALIEAFLPVKVAEPEVALPAFTPIGDAPTHRMRFTCWYSWMDPLDHANHPLYLDWCDEATSRVLVAAGLPPADLVAVAERIQWRSGVIGGVEVFIESRLAGRSAGGHAVIDHRVNDGAGGTFATARCVRRLSGGGDGLFEALRAAPAAT